MRKESKEMAVTATTMKKEKRNEPAATTFVNYLESWYQNEYLPNSTSSSTDAYYHWMIFNVIEPSLPDKERAVDDIDAEYLNALLARIDRKNENMAVSAYRFLRVFIKDSFEPEYPGLAEEGALCLGPYGKVKTLPTLNTRLKKITQSYGLPRISLGDLRYMYLADLIKKEKQFKKIMELFGYANPYRMLNLCQQIADIQGETLTVNVPFPEIFYYKM